MRQIGLRLIALLMVGIFQQPAAQSVGSRDSLTIQIFPVVGEKNWMPEATYTNAAGESFSIDKCLFYLSNFAVQTSSGKWYPIKDSYFLVNIQDSNSLQIRLPILFSDIVNIRFLVGVDSTKNVSGIQSGVLDPARGMFWTWNTGYVMAKMEGSSPVSPMPGKKFTYHVGGFAGEQNVTKLIQLAINKKSIEQHRILLSADLLSWFNGATPLSIAAHPICHVPGMLANQIANNYQFQFRVIQ
jgi:hypothetical protein